MLSIGQLTISSPLILAPMAGISDLPYRLLNRSFGCELAFTEMISASSIVHKSRHTSKMLSVNANDRPLGVQILGSDAGKIKNALDILSEYQFDVTDFNAACPVNKVVSRGEGAALLKEPARLQKLLEVIVDNASGPVTVKIRSGWDETSVNAREVAVRAEDAGVAGLFIHGRTKVQGYRGTVDYDIIRGVKEAVAVPVIASGDALTPDLIKKLFNETGCDAVTVARGALGNPWIFREAAALLQYGIAPPGPDIKEIVQTMRGHLLMNIVFHGEKTGVMLFRKFFSWYTKGMALKELKNRAFRAEAGDAMLTLIEEMETLIGSGVVSCGSML